MDVVAAEVGWRIAESDCITTFGNPQFAKLLRLLCSLRNDLQRVLHLDNSVDLAREHDRLLSLGLTLHAARQRDNTLVGVDVDSQSAHRRVVEHGGFDTS